MSALIKGERPWTAKCSAVLPFYGKRKDHEDSSWTCWWPLQTRDKDDIFCKVTKNTFSLDFCSLVLHYELRGESALAKLPGMWGFGSKSVFMYVSCLQVFSIFVKACMLVFYLFASTAVTAQMAAATLGNLWIMQWPKILIRWVCDVCRSLGIWACYVFSLSQPEKWKGWVSHENLQDSCSEVE